MGTADCEADLEFRIQPNAVKDAGETLKIRVSFYDFCVVRWQPNEPYSVGDYVRPSSGNGFAYRCTTAGVSGSVEPRFPATVAATKADGSAVWTCEAPGVNGLNAISSPSPSVDPAGLTIQDVSVSESTKLLATYVGGTLDQDYEAIFTFTLDGVPRVARQRVKIRKR